MKRIIVVFVIFITVVFIALGRVYPKLGSAPSIEMLKSFKFSKNFNNLKLRFENKHEYKLVEAQNKLDNWAITRDFIFPKNEVIPQDKLPEENPDVMSFVENNGQIKFIWLGHSTFLLNIDGNIILVDPIFSNSAAPISFLSPRFQKPILKLTDLPQIDFIVISHDHYDHLDYETMKYFKDKNVRYLVPLGVSSHLLSWGIARSEITEMDWWDEVNIEGVRFICAPAQHFSGRLSPYENKTLWASWIIQGEKSNIFYSGDTGYSEHFKEIGNKFGPFDVSFIENGQYDEQWRPVHVLPEEAAKAYFDLKSKAIVPVHWGMFNLALHNWYDPIEEISNLAKTRGINLYTPKIGQIVTLNNKEKFSAWWKQLFKK